MSFFKSVVSALCLGAVLISAQVRRRTWGNNNAGNGLAIAENVLGIVDAALGGYGYGGGWGGGYGGIGGGYDGVPNCRPVNCYGWEYWEPRTCRCERRASRCPFGEIWVQNHALLHFHFVEGYTQHNFILRNAYLSGLH